jgi:hypothetical protein
MNISGIYRVKEEINSLETAKNVLIWNEDEKSMVNAIEKVKF